MILSILNHFKFNPNIRADLVVKWSAYLPSTLMIQFESHWGMQFSVRTEVNNKKEFFKLIENARQRKVKIIWLWLNW